MTLVNPCLTCEIHISGETKGQECAECEDRLSYVSFMAGRDITPVPVEGRESLQLKKCSRCREHKPLTSFWKMAQAKDGLFPSCKECSAKKKNKGISTKKEIDTLPKSETAKKASKLEIDFTGYEDILEYLFTVSKEEIRTPEQHIIFLVKFQMEYKDEEDTE